MTAHARKGEGIDERHMQEPPSGECHVSGHAGWSLGTAGKKKNKPGPFRTRIGIDEEETRDQKTKYTRRAQSQPG